MDPLMVAAVGAAISTAHVIFFSMDDERQVNDVLLEKVDAFAEETVPRMSHRQFRQHFRMNPSTFDDLLRKLSTIYVRRNKVGMQGLDFEKQVLLTVWYLANLESFRSVADRFGISKSTAWSSFYKVCLKVVRMNTEYLIISWPRGRRANRTIAAFHQKANFPGIIGAIDGSHIPITAPHQFEQSYINRKGFHSVLLQGVCDPAMRFIDCYTGEVGSIHDACLFRRSDLARRLPLLPFPQDSHLIGDSAYKLTARLMVPYKNMGNLTVNQLQYNTALAKSRVVIEQCFGLLKGRFRRLKLIEAQRMELVPLIVLSACILHNVCILNGDNIDDIDIAHEVREERLMNPPVDVEVALDAAARHKRDRIANALQH